jgi:hypothetical protein
MARSDLPVLVLFSEQAISHFFGEDHRCDPPTYNGALGLDGHGLMTGQEKLRRHIDALNAMIQFDLGELQRNPLSADERLVIKNHLDMLISDMQTLLQRVELSPSGAEIPYREV